MAFYPLFLFLALYFQELLELSPTGTGLRLLPITLVLFLVAPLSGKATSLHLLARPARRRAAADARAHRVR